MAHKTLVNGTAYDITGGKTLVSGTSYNIAGGKTLVGGTGYNISFESTIGSLAVGSIIQLKESGVPVEFYVAEHDYESGLNGSGRTLLVRKDCYDTRAWHSSNVNAYASSAIDTWLNSTYKAFLDASIQVAMSTTMFYYTPGKGTTSVETLSRDVFLLSVTELGSVADYANTEGIELPISGTYRIAYLNGSKVSQWTRSPNTLNTQRANNLNTNGAVTHNYCSNTRGSRPAFTLPSDFVI